jgi:hypothetical protein
MAPRLWLGVPALAVLCSNSVLYAVAEGIEYKSAQQSVRTMMFMSTTDVTDTFGLMSVHVLAVCTILQSACMTVDRRQ